jgi:hypothetical protein
MQILALPSPLWGLVLLVLRCSLIKLHWLCLGLWGPSVTLPLSNGTGPLAAMVVAILPAEGRSSGIAVWKSIANLGGFVGPALFGWLKAHTGFWNGGAQLPLVFFKFGLIFF